jgi:hypothetical protein
MWEFYNLSGNKLQELNVSSTQQLEEYLNENYVNWKYSNDNCNQVILRDGIFYKIEDKMLKQEENIGAVIAPTWNTASKDGGNYDIAGNSEHYQKQFMEFVRAQERLYGTIVAYLVCVANVDKYNQRAGQKAGVPAEKDLTKRDWYQKAARHFKLKIESKQAFSYNVKGRNKYVFMPEEVVDLIKSELNLKDETPDYVPLSVAIEK